MKRGTLTASLAITFMLGSLVGCNDSEGAGGGGAGGGAPAPTCDSICQRVGSCPGGSADECSASCAQYDEIAAATGCTTEKDAMISCYDSAEDVCGEACTSESEVFNLCILASCNDDPSQEFCPPPSGCEGACERTKLCETGDPTVDCEAQCAELDAIAAAIGCTAESDAFVNCVSTSADACNAVECEAEFTAMGECNNEFCTNNPDDPNCG